MLGSYELSVVADHLEFRFQHHDAMEDALACANVVLRSLQEKQSDTVEALWEALEFAPREFPRGSLYRSQSKFLDFSKFREGNKNSKLKKAETYAQNGQDIETIAEYDFLSLL